MKKGNSLSIRMTLKNIADNENIRFQDLITRYLHERLIYRLSVSEYAQHFLLKVGALLYAFSGLHTRPTMDIDMLAKHIDNDKDKIKTFFENICKIDYPDDCVIFEQNTIDVSDIAEDAKYNGGRVVIDALFDTIRQRLQIDFGFSDIVSSPIELDFPVLMEELDAPKIKAYSIETVIAEKFHAMIVMGTFNSRIKDFYDIYTLFKNKEITNSSLHNAIKETFENRNTICVEEAVFFSESFYKDTVRIIMWNAFLRKIKVEHIDFDIVVKYITAMLLPIYNSLINSKL